MGKISHLRLFLQHEKHEVVSRQFDTDIGSKFMQEIEMIIVDRLNIEAVIIE